jgi:hypothetical protein
MYVGSNSNLAFHMGVNEGVRVLPEGTTSPLGAKFPWSKLMLKNVL